MTGLSPDVAARTAAALAEARAVRPIHAAPSSNNPLNDLVAALTAAADPLPMPVSDVGHTRPFADVLASRRSERELHPPSIDDVGTVMARAGLTRSRTTDRAGAPIAHRAAPSAGARHPLTLVLLAQRVLGLTSGSWVLDPDWAVLRPGTKGPRQIKQALTEIARATGQVSPPPAALLAVAHPDRTLSRYPLGISLLWRETGALLMLVHLAAADLGLGSCIVGTCGVLYADNGSGTGPVDLGAVALGVVDAEARVESAPSEEA